MSIDRNLNYGREKMQELFRQAMPFKSVLDLGAGTGEDLLAAKSLQPMAKFYGIEYFPEYREKLKAQGIEAFPLNLEQEKIPFEPESLDLITNNQFLEHTKEIFWIFHELSRVLKVDGHLVIGVPNLASFHNRLLLLLGRQPTCVQTASAHVRGFTKQDLMKFLNLSFPGGYELKDFKGSNFYPFPPSLAKPLANVFPNSAYSIFFLLQKKKAYRDEFVAFPTRERLETNYFLGM